MNEIFIHQNDRDFRAPDLATLRQWVRDRRIRPDSQVFDPVQQRWIAVRDHLDLRGYLPASPIDVASLARNYRQLVLSVGLQLLLTPALMLNCSVLLAVPAFAATIIALPYYAYRTAEALGESTAPLWALSMPVPLLNIVVLLMLSSRATAVCRENGIAVGFLGPRI